MITAAQLTALSPRLANAPLWAEALSEWMPTFGIDTEPRAAMFLAQALHESAGFTQLSENLDYSAARLVAVFPKYFPDEAAALPFAHRPEAIANRVYANRGENGDAYTGDGWRFRGRGIFQVTFRANYANCSRAILRDPTRLITEPDLLTDPDHAIASAVWYWGVNDLNRYADAGDVDACRDLIWRGRRTAAIGDSAGHEHVAKLLEQAEAVLA